MDRFLETCEAKLGRIRDPRSRELKEVPELARTCARDFGEKGVLAFCSALERRVRAARASEKLASLYAVDIAMKGGGGAYRAQLFKRLEVLMSHAESCCSRETAGEVRRLKTIWAQKFGVSLSCVGEMRAAHGQPSSAPPAAACCPPTNSAALHIPWPVIARSLVDNQGRIGTVECLFAVLSCVVAA